jgi:hypothetical protein
LGLAVHPGVIETENWRYTAPQTVAIAQEMNNSRVIYMKTLGSCPWNWSKRNLLGSGRVANGVDEKERQSSPSSLPRIRRMKRLLFGAYGSCSEEFSGIQLLISRYLEYMLPCTDKIHFSKPNRHSLIEI